MKHTQRAKLTPGRSLFRGGCIVHLLDAWLCPAVLFNAAHALFVIFHYVGLASSASPSTSSSL
jgi:hypothetical protein